LTTVLGVGNEVIALIFMSLNVLRSAMDYGIELSRYLKTCRRAPSNNICIESDLRAEPVSHGIFFRLAGRS
jgi:hypothetical protein